MNEWKKPQTSFRADGRNEHSSDRKPAVRPSVPRNARRAAFDVLQLTLHQDAYASLALNQALKDSGLSQADKRLCTSIVYTTLENLTAIDYALHFFLKDPLSLDPKVRDVLRLSVCQYLFMDKIPDNAIADEAVKLTRSLGLEALTGLVNGVLRSMMREKNKIVWPEETNREEYLSIRYSWPKWLVGKLTECYGSETAEKIITYRQDEHFMTMRPNLSRLTDADFETLLEKKVWKAEKGLVPHAWRVRGVSSVAQDYQYMNGDFSIQGESSILCALAADVKRGNQVIDCCAAPGGKTAFMAEVLAGTGRVFAWDLHEHRVELLRSMARRLHLDNVRPVVRDSTVFKADLEQTADVVLLDAPCSGLGVADDKPDIKYHVTEQTLDSLLKTQEKLLNTCSQYVKRGGTLVYSTCSILPQENKEQVKKFLDTHPDFVMDSLPKSIPEQFTQYADEYGLQLFQYRDDIEGFFIARMKRR